MVSGHRMVMVGDSHMPRNLCGVGLMGKANSLGNALVAQRLWPLSRDVAVYPLRNEHYLSPHTSRQVIAHEKQTSFLRSRRLPSVDPILFRRGVGLAVGPLLLRSAFDQKRTLACANR